MIIHRGFLKGVAFFFASVSAVYAGAPSSPPNKCEIKQAAWCIQQGAFEITERMVNDGVNDHAWILSGQFRPDSKLVFLEPNGCRNGVSNTLELIDYEHNAKWDEQLWEKLKIRLNSDGMCDIVVLFPALNNDPLEWAYSTGLMLVKTCYDDLCKGNSLSDIKPSIAHYTK